MQRIQRKLDIYQQQIYEKLFNNPYSCISQQFEYSFKKKSNSHTYLSQQIQKQQIQLNSQTLQQLICHQPNPLFQQIPIKIKGKLRKPKITNRVQPRNIRLDPFAKPRKLKKQDLKVGLINLIDIGIVPKHVDIRPAFQSNDPIFKIRKARLLSVQQRNHQPTQITAITANASQRHNNSSGWALTALNAQQIYRKQHQKQSIKNQNTIIRNTQQKSNSKIQKQKYIFPGVCLNMQDKHLFIKFGKIQWTSQTLQFMKKNFQQQIADVNQIIYQICNFSIKRGIMFLNVSLLRVLQLIYKNKKLQKREIMDVIVGNNSQKSFIQQKQKIFKINIIKAHLKGYLLKKKYSNVMHKKLMQKKLVRLLQKSWRKKKLKDNYKLQVNNKMKIFQQQQKLFFQQYNQIINDQHVIIHVCNQKQPANHQIIRLFSLGSPKSIVILLLQRMVSDQTFSFFQRILDLNQINHQQRLKIIQANPKGYLSSKISTSGMAYFSLNVQKIIKKTISNRKSFMICSRPIINDIMLSVQLQIPILSGDYQISKTLSSRIGSQKIFKKVGIKCFQQIISPNSTTKHLINILNQQQSKFKTQNFIIKLNQQSMSKGTAVINLHQVSQKGLTKSIQMVWDNQNQDTFLQTLLQKGGVIQPYMPQSNNFTIAMFIKPNGEIQVTGSYTKITVNLIAAACVFPQKVVQHQLVLQLVQKLRGKLQGIRGYVSVDFLWRQNQAYGIGIDCFSNRFQASGYYFNFLMRGQYKTNGYYQVQVQQVDGMITYQNRCLAYIPWISVQGVRNMVMKTFFALCRTENIIFDLIGKYGSTFVLFNSLSSGLLGIFCVSQSQQQSLKLLFKVLRFFSKLKTQQPYYQKQPQLKQILDAIKTYIG